MLEKYNLRYPDIVTMPVGSDKAVWNCWVISIALSFVDGVTLLTLGTLAETTVGGCHAAALVSHPADVPGLVACQQKLNEILVPSWVGCSTRVFSTIHFCYVMRLCSTLFNFENVQN